MTKPNIARTVQAGRKVTGQEIADTVQDIAHQIGGLYVQRLASDYDGDTAWYIGIQGNNLHEDVEVRTDPLGILGIKLEDSYENLYVVATEWHGRGQLNYDVARLTNHIERVQGVLEKVLNRG